MKIDSPRFGTLEIQTDRIIEFPRGLVGFEKCTRYALFHPEGEAPTFFILQSLDDAAIAFQIADPARLGFTYELELSDTEAAELQMPAGERRVSSSGSEIAVVVVLSNEGEGKPVRANLNGPLVINLAARRGLQHVFARLDYRIEPESA